MIEGCGKVPAGGILVGATFLLMPSTAFASDGAPDANLFGLLVTALILVAAGVGAWVSLRERQ